MCISLGQATETRLKQAERGVEELQAALEAAQQDAVEAATSAQRAERELRAQQSLSAQHQRLLRQYPLFLSSPVLTSQLFGAVPAPHATTSQSHGCSSDLYDKHIVLICGASTHVGRRQKSMTKQ